MSETPITTPRSWENLSRRQYGDLRFIFRNKVTMARLRKANMTTLTSLAYRGYLRRMGMGEDAEVFLTPLGEEALKRYEEAGLFEKNREAELTERCLRLLRHSRRILPMTRSA